MKPLHVHLVRWCRQEIEITREEIYSTHTTKKAGYVVERDRCRRDNNPPHESFVESDSMARMSYHNHPKSRLHSIT